MGEQRNLTEDNVAELREHLERMKKGNPDLEYRFFPQDEKPDQGYEEPSNTMIMDKLESLERKIDLIFDGHVLINGTFKKVEL